MRRETKQTFLQGRFSNGQQVHEKILDITNNQGNANHNLNELSPLTNLRAAIIKKARDNEFWQECGEKGMPVHSWQEGKSGQPLWETAWSFYKKLKQNYHAHTLSCFSRVRLSATPWTVACQAPLSMVFSRQEYWSGLPFSLQLLYFLLINECLDDTSFSILLLATYL